ncbi:MAG: FkbM family methyltransferase, partial [Pseudomonadota bacterium]
MPKAMAQAAQELAADAKYASLRRSFDTYYGSPERDAAMDALYRRFVPAGGLAFDVGAHVGDRTASFRRLGARVVTLEPQPVCAAALHELFKHDDGVTLVMQACSTKPQRLMFHVNSANPTVSTASPDFIEQAKGAEGWAGQNWDSELTVEATTLDRLIAQHGLPDFIKIDVEGYEEAVLAGLSHAPKALSFEFTTIDRSTAVRALQRLVDLGNYRFDVALGESQSLRFGPGKEVSGDT